MKVLVTGSSGLIGSALITFLKETKDDVYRLVRARADLLPHEIAWDPNQGVFNPQLLEGFDAVVHLGGESIMGRWSQAKKERIRSSRVNSTQLLCQTLSKLKNPPNVFLCASALGYYGNRGDEILTEQSRKGEGFLADVCAEWEEATQAAAKKGIRVANLRFGMVLSPKGGALKQMLPIFKWGLGGELGDGKQYISWIALDDLIRVIEYVLKHQHLAGPINVATPYPVTNAELTKTLGRVLHRPTFFSLPTFPMQLIFGEQGQELLLSSERVQPKKLEEAGFQFNYPHLEEALRHLLG